MGTIHRALLVQATANAPFFVPHALTLGKTYRQIGTRLRKRKRESSRPREGYVLTHIFSWIYALFLAIDANFRLKRLSASSDARDPSLNQGSAYFVEEVRYKEFLNAHGRTNIEEASTCNNYDAVKSASIRGGKGTTASGVGTIECSRHDMKRPVSVGDLQKGERYAASSYIGRIEPDAII